MKFSLRFLLAIACLGSLTAHASLTVNNGAQGLQTAPGATNDVWADPASSTTVFDHWTGDAGILADPYAWHTTALMPSTAAVITATYKSAPAWTPTTYILNGLAPTDPSAIRLIYFFPTNPRGIIFIFHGSGGGALDWFSDTQENLNNDDIENYIFIRDAIAAGYAVAALDSTDRTDKTWDLTSSSTNEDVVNVQASITYFIGLGLMNASTPQFSLGMSNGGQFAEIPAYYLGFQGCALFCAPGQPAALYQTTTVPTIWNLQYNDDEQDHTTILPTARLGEANLQAQTPPVPNQLSVNQPSPVYPRRFLRVPGLTAADSQAIYDSLNTGGYLDSLGYLIANPLSSGWESVIPAQYNFCLGDISDQVICCYSEHHFFTDYDDKVLQFFGAQLSPALPADGTFAQWESTYSFSGSPNDAPEQDGVPNLLKYVYDINPAQPMSASDRSALPVIGLDTTTTPGTTYETLNYRQNSTLTGVTVNLQTSPDLQAWTTVTPDLTRQTGLDPITGDPILELEVKVTGAPPFLRLNVTEP